MGDNKEFSLALSGGGFRASLFHIGVLMKLSEVGLLQKATTISTVSGGSIIGMLYYLHLKYLLETKENVSKEDVITIVKDVKEEFLNAVRKNIIMVPLKRNLIQLIEAGINPDYSRTNVLAEVYQKEIYNNIWKKIVDYWKKQKDRPEEWKDVDKDENPYLYRLKIYPKGIFKKKDFSEFNINTYNEDYSNQVKVPDLIINATNLNTGNLWRFSATKFGEYLSIKDVFANATIKKLFYEKCTEKEIYRLRSEFGIEKLLELLTDKEKSEQFFIKNQLENTFKNFENFRISLENFFDQLIKFTECHLYQFFSKKGCKKLSEELKKSIKIGDAVASSACVPGIFAPYVFNEEKFGNYKEIYRIDKLLLVDGGVYDNQGLESVERKVIKSKIKNRKEKEIGLVFCSDASGQLYVKELSSKTLKVVSRSSNVMGKRLRMLTIDKLYSEKNKGSLKFILIHLKQHVKNPVEELKPPLTFDKEIAELNSKLRTQLNKFWDEEIKSLITQGYVLSEYFLYRFFRKEITEISTDFRKEIIDYYNDIEERKEEFKRILKMGQSTFPTLKIALFKIFQNKKGA